MRLAPVILALIASIPGVACSRSSPEEPRRDPPAVAASPDNGVVSPPAPPPPPPPGNDPQGGLDYRLELPAHFIHDNDVQGIDSKVELWRSPGAEVSTDFGMYSSAPECGFASRNCSIESGRIAERQALVGRYRWPHGNASEELPHVVFVHVPVTREIKLNLFARCRTEQACEDALENFHKGLTISR